MKVVGSFNETCGDISFEIVKLVLCHNELISQNNLKLALDKSQCHRVLWALID